MSESETEIKPKSLELTLNRDLLDPKFENYKLSLDKIPVVDMNLDPSPLHLTPTDSQWSFQHLKAFGDNNQLYQFRPGAYLYFSSEGLHEVSIDLKTRQTTGPILRCNYPCTKSTENYKHLHRYNPTLINLCNQLILLSGGHGDLALYLIEDVSQNWSPIFEAKPLDNKVPFMLLDAKMAPNSNMLHCLLQEIEEQAPEDKDEKSYFLTSVHWVVVQGSGMDNWQITRRRRLETRGNLEFARLILGADSALNQVVICCNRKVEFVFDSDKEIIKPEKPTQDPREITVDGMDVDQNDEVGPDEKSPTEQHGVPFNSGQLEECDTVDDENSLWLGVWNGEDHREEYQADISSRHLIFVRSPKSDLEFCLRHDVDGVLWVLRRKSNDLRLEHRDTFNALGYVQASKEHRRFTVCPDERNYSAIVDEARRIYVYWKPEPVISELTNRKTKQRVSAVSKQQLISVPNEEQIIGAEAEEKILAILTDKKIYFGLI